MILAGQPVTADMPLKELMEQYPETIAVLIQRRVNCVGCYISSFHTLADTAREYALALDMLLYDLNRAIAQATCQGWATRGEE